MLNPFDYLSIMQTKFQWHHIAFYGPRTLMFLKLMIYLALLILLLRKGLDITISCKILKFYWIAQLSIFTYFFHSVSKLLEVFGYHHCPFLLYFCFNIDRSFNFLFLTKLPFFFLCLFATEHNPSHSLFFPLLSLLCASRHGMFLSTR